MSLIFKIWLAVAVARFMVWAAGLVVSTRMTRSAVNAFVTKTLREGAYGKLVDSPEEVFEFDDRILPTEVIAHEVPGVPSGYLFEFRVYPDSAGFGRSSKVFLFIRSEEHFEWIREKLKAAEAASEALEKAIKTGIAPHEHDAIGREVASLSGRAVPGKTLEESVT